MKPRERRMYRAFVVDQAHGTGGNLCELVVFPEQPEMAPLTILASSPDVSCCVTWPLDEGLYQLVCMQHGEIIQCCGHGLLSAARYWLDYTGLTSLALRMHDSTLPVRREFLPFVNCIRVSDWPLALQFEPRRCEPVEVDQRIAGLLANQLRGDLAEAQPIAAAQSSADDGYLLFRYADNFALSDLHPPGVELAQFTRRALIVTAKHAAEDVNVWFRYFAPQYGVMEDNATGSAMPVLVDFWQRELPVLRARQLSPEGGMLYATQRGSSIEVAGFCKQIDDYVI